MAVNAAITNPHSRSDSATIWLLLWTFNNIGVTLLNKYSFANLNFQYPFFLSFVHMACNYAGSSYLLRSMAKSSNRGETSCINSMMKLGNLQPKELDAAGKKMMLAFSLIFSLNIAIGNVSLRFVSVNFNQVMRSLVPAVTIGMGLLMGKDISVQRQKAVVPVVVGVAMATFGDMSFTGLGFFFTVLCILFAGLKVVASGEMLTGNLRLHPVDLLGNLAPRAMWQCLVFSIVTGELSEIWSRWSTELSPFVDSRIFTAVMLSGLFSFSLNITSFNANRLTSPLTLCITANVKQVLMIAVSTIMFGIEISVLNGIGIIVVLAGSSRYGYVSVLEKQTVGALPPSRKDEEEGVALVNSGSNSELTSK